MLYLLRLPLFVSTFFFRVDRSLRETNGIRSSRRREASAGSGTSGRDGLVGLAKGRRRLGKDSVHTRDYSFLLSPFQSFCLMAKGLSITLTSENDSVYTAYCHFYWTKRTVFTRKTTLSPGHRPIRCWRGQWKLDSVHTWDYSFFLSFSFSNGQRPIRWTLAKDSFHTGDCIFLLTITAIRCLRWTTGK